jgi:hypothetical protein
MIALHLIDHFLIENGLPSQNKGPHYSFFLPNLWYNQRGKHPRINLPLIGGTFLENILKNRQ